MLKKFVVIACSLVLMSCQENSKVKLQDLINNKDYVNAKVMVEEMLGQRPNDGYYNGAMGYILSVECLSTNCTKNDPTKLKRIKHYVAKSNGLARIDNAYFVDFYQKIMVNIVKLAAKQDSLELAKLTLKEFVNQTNPRISFIYNELYKGAITSLVNDDLTKSALNLTLLQELNFKLTQEQKVSIDLLISFEKNKPIEVMRSKIKAFNRVFIGRELPREFLVALAPAVIEYGINNNIKSIIRLLERSVEERSTILNENVAVLRQPENVKFYAKGVELVSKSESILSLLEEKYDEDKQTFVVELQNISLKLNPDNKDLWADYIKSIIEHDEIDRLYQKINIEYLKPTVVIANNDILIEYANQMFSTQSIIPLLNELVFRDDSNKDFYTKESISLVEKALKLEISKNNLEGIFEYLNYIPSVKSKFTGELNQKLTQYIDVAWEKNNFDNLNKLIELHKDLNENNNNSIVASLFEQYLLTVNSEDFFVAETIQDYIQEGSKDININNDMNEKYDYVLLTLKNEDLQTILFSIARKMEGLYTQSKVFTYFSDVFSKTKRDDLIIDAVSTALEKDENITLMDLIDLSDILISKTDKLPENYIENKIIPRFTSIDDVKAAWARASSRTKKKLVRYNVDIRNLIKAVENDKVNKKITASKYIGKVKSKQMLPFVENYKKQYHSYISQVKGFYVKDLGEEGPEVIEIAPTDNLLQVQVSFVSRLGKIENLDKYKLDRGEIASKVFTSYYNPVTSYIALAKNYSNKDLKVFTKASSLKINGANLIINNQSYKKVKSLFEFNQRYGVVEQFTDKTKDNFHILPEGSNFSIIDKLTEDAYTIKIHHPAMLKPILVNAIFDKHTLSFKFEYDYTIRTLGKTFSAKAKCQLLNSKAYCAVQDKHWKREMYSVISKALQVK